MEGISELDRFLAILEVGARTRPNPDGSLAPDALKAIRSLAGLPLEGPPQGQEQGAEEEQPEEAMLSLEEPEDGYLEDCQEECLGECISSEPPGPGWMYCGGGKWLKIS